MRGAVARLVVRKAYLKIRIFWLAVSVFLEGHLGHASNSEFTANSVGTEGS